MPCSRGTHTALHHAGWIVLLTRGSEGSSDLEWKGCYKNTVSGWCVSFQACVSRLLHMRHLIPRSAPESTCITWNANLWLAELQQSLRGRSSTDLDIPTQAGVVDANSEKVILFGHARSSEPPTESFLDGLSWLTPLNFYINHITPLALSSCSLSNPSIATWLSK